MSKKQVELSQRNGNQVQVFPILDKCVTITPELASYNNYRLKFKSLAQQMLITFLKRYKNEITKENFITNVPDLIDEFVDQGYDLCIKEILAHKVYSFDKEMFRDAYDEEISAIWGDRYASIARQIQEINADLKSADEQRTARREGRDRWSGLTVKGAAKAGALNAAEGTAHMMFNGIANFFDECAADSKKDSLVTSDDSVMRLANGVFNAVFFLHICLIDCLSDLDITDEPLHGTISDDEIKKAQALFNNAKLLYDNGEFKKAELVDLLIASFNYNPYNSEWYSFILDKFGDKDGRLQDLDNYFGIGAVTADRKRDLLEEFGRNLPSNTEDEALCTKQKIENYAITLGYNGTSKIQTQIAEKLQKFDEEARTFDGVLLPTRSDVAQCRQEQEKINDVLNAVDFESLESVKSSIQRLKLLKSALAKIRCQEVIDKASVAFEKKYDSIEAAFSARSIHTQIQSSIANIDTPEAPEQIKQNISSSDLPDNIKDKLNHELDTKVSEREANQIASQLAKAEFPYSNTNSLNQIAENGQLAPQEKELLRCLLYFLDSQHLMNLIKNAQYPQEEESVFEHINKSNLPSDVTKFKPDTERLERILAGDGCVGKIKDIVYTIKNNKETSIFGKEKLRSLVMKHAHPTRFKVHLVKQFLKNVLGCGVPVILLMIALHYLIGWVSEAVCLLFLLGLIGSEISDFRDALK